MLYSIHPLIESLHTRFLEARKPSYIFSFAIDCGILKEPILNTTCPNNFQPLEIPHVRVGILLRRTTKGVGGGVRPGVGLLKMIM